MVAAVVIRRRSAVGEDDAACRATDVVVRRLGIGTERGSVRGLALDNARMCRSIKTLRPPFAEDVTHDDIRAAALQYVRKVSGFRRPAGHNAAAFERAVDEIERATAELLDALEIRGAAASPA